MKRFDYKLITISSAHLKKKDFQEELNFRFQKWGDEGWDLVKMEPIIAPSGMSYMPRTKQFLVVFKREKP